MTSLLRDEVSNPIVEARSRTSTPCPASASARAVASPTTPAPTTTHSTSSTPLLLTWLTLRDRSAPDRLGPEPSATADAPLVSSTTPYHPGPLRVVLAMSRRASTLPRIGRNSAVRASDPDRPRIAQQVRRLCRVRRNSGRRCGPELRLWARPHRATPTTGRDRPRP